MIAAIAVLGIVCVLLLGALVYRETQNGKHVADREQRWERERAELLGRIQHPHVFVAPPRTDAELEAMRTEEPTAPKEVDEIDLVGAVVTSTPQESHG
jgi:hypothetical protein